MLVTNLKELKRKSEPITNSKELGQVYRELVKAYSDIKNANKVGLAAPQIGIFKQVSLIQYGDTRLLLVNPIIEERDEKIQYNEACLSLPGIGVLTDRYNQVLLENGWNTLRNRGVYEGFLAVVIQHEVDHLNGITILDRKHRRR